MKRDRLLIVSMHLNGGCFQYSNELISRMQGKCDIYVPEITLEEHKLMGYKTLNYYGCNSLRRYISLFFFLVRIIICGWIGYYHSLLLCGFTSWDYWIMKAWKLTGRKSYFIVHDGKMHSGEADQKNQRKLIKTMTMASSLIFLSEYVRELVHQNFKIDKPYYIAPHGLIDYGPMKENKEKVDKPTLLFLGRVSVYKGVDILLEALQYVPDDIYHKVIIAGKWDYIRKREVNKDKVEIIDKWLSNEEIVDFISISDIMLFPYIEATQSGVATLAINYGKPSIVSNVGAFSEQFDATSVVFIDKLTPQILGEKIIEICSDKDMYCSMKKSLSNLKKLYSWDFIASGLEKYIYDANAESK